YEARLDAVEARLNELGAQVRHRFVQRRGVSHGGVRLMNGPLSRRFLITPGKVDEVAAACERDDVDAVVFVNVLSAYQRRWLGERLRRVVFGAGDLE
ncbi:MAG TPA: hypothetical protein VL738_04475, partial [Dactylosporangium sp.]|nr:hypothetical protein [Dactylosporangium sp.]